MNPALLRLIFLQTRGTLRRITRGARSPARIAALLIGAMIFLVWLSTSLLALSYQPHVDPARVRAAMPVALLAICILTAVTSAGDKAIAFTPGEIDQLFPGPFARRELLAFKLLKSALIAVLTALVLSVVMQKYASGWLPCLVGMFLALLFVQWFSIGLLLGGQAIGQAAYGRARWGVLIVAAALAALGLRSVVHTGFAGGLAAAQQFRASPIGRFSLAPFDPYARVITADGAGDLLRWCVPAIVLNGALLWLVFLLDAYYVEAAMSASERRYAKIQRIRGGSFLSMGGGGGTARWRLPAFAWAGGAGPVAWRQATRAARSLRGLVVLLLIAGITMAVAGSASSRAHGPTVARMLSTGLLYVTFFASTLMTFDFRGDVDQIENLKALPLGERAITAGQLVVPTVLMTLLHWLLLAIAMITLGRYRATLAVAIAMAPPFNAVLFGAENLIFLLFPSRPAAASPGDFQVMGRKFVFLLLKGMILAATIGIAACPAIFIWVISGKNLAAATVLAWIVLTAEAAAMVPVIAIAYRRFDPSVHTPA